MVDNSSAVGYFGYAYVVGDNRIEAEAVFNEEIGEFVEPSATTISSKEYAPFSRPLYVNVHDTQAVLAKVNPFMVFGYSSDGDQLVRDIGYVPTTLAERKIMLTRLGAEGGTAISDIPCGSVNGSFSIAGSSTVFPVAELWAGIYTVPCSTINISVEGGGSSVGARRVCDQSSEPGETGVDIGNMSRQWRIPSEATTTNNWEYSCSGSSRMVTQVSCDI